jgi:hypothetical protein
MSVAALGHTLSRCGTDFIGTASRKPCQKKKKLPAHYADDRIGQEELAVVFKRELANSVFTLGVFESVPSV